jgi:hypothetical protein
MACRCGIEQHSDIIIRFLGSAAVVWSGEKTASPSAKATLEQVRIFVGLNEFMSGYVL